MLFETEVRTLLEISTWVVGIFLVAASLISFKKNNSGIYFILFAILNTISLFGLKHLLNTVETNPVMASEENTLRFYLFIFPWIISMVFLIFGIIKSNVKQNS